MHIRPGFSADRRGSERRPSVGREGPLVSAAGAVPARTSVKNAGKTPTHGFRIMAALRVRVRMAANADANPVSPRLPACHGAATLSSFRVWQEILASPSPVILSAQRRIYAVSPRDVDPSLRLAMTVLRSAVTALLARSRQEKRQPQALTHEPTKVGTNRIRRGSFPSAVRRPPSALRLRAARHRKMAAQLGHRGADPAAQGFVVGAAERVAGSIRRRSASRRSPCRRVVRAGVPMRMPEGSIGLRGSKGIMFLFTVIPQRPKASSAWRPVRPTASRRPASGGCRCRR